MTQGFLMGLLVLGMVACSGRIVKTDYDRSLRFDRLKTYAWQVNVSTASTTDQELDKRIRSAVEGVMTVRGFRIVEEPEADLMLTYEASAEELPDATNLKNYDTAAFMGLTKTLGTLKLRMKDNFSSREVWSGFVQANIDLTKPVKKRDVELREAVGELLEKFPPEQSK